MKIEQTKSLDDAIHHLQSLPPTLREEVFHYIDFLRMRRVSKSTQEKERKVIKRLPGTAKGKAVFSDDFDEPLEEFKDYM